MTLPPVKIGLIGLGKMGQNHLRVLSLMKDTDLAFVYDLDGAAAAQLALQNGVKTGSDLDSLLDLVDAVVICTPTITHGDYLRLVASKVQNIFVEKPLAHSLAETQALATYAADEGLRVQIGFIERFNPAVQQLKSVLGESAGVVSVDFTRTNKLSARITDVDVVTDLMIHDIDLALHLNGPVVDVSAHGLAEGEMINFASALLTHGNGRFSRVQASRITDKKMRSIQATCVDMFIDCELVRKELVISRQSEIRQKDGGPFTITAIEQTIEVRQQEALLNELQAFVTMCRTGQAQGPDETDGLRAAEICHQVQQAVLS
ncbi:Gfo/Idh/MocA family protein [Allosphingosinicella vermicomposti]|uniref:Gfo/Idh/MocA family protein n=1 Tax=Allosphingosinicella vermicomposti TaxID=614671 RepID=UPI000D1131C1|nr:Gfo/Idh/MocA family oxidoreductase [Allosphingosinicella vermicomposti]